MKNGWYTHPIRVRYQETDQMSVVFHANYVTWFEIGRTEWIRNMGYHYRDIEAKGLLLPVIDLAVKYVSPAKYDDMVIVCTRMEQCTPLRIAFESQVRKVTHDKFISAEYTNEVDLPGDLLVNGGTKHVWVNTSFQPTRVSKVMPELYEVITNN
ncbi:MAG TPA: acyl-CoA thioesterase [Candidatus Paenibacillus intestinavium]|nr:acyl-CoA thioesterase [Candidatus Paenibacillus intestinavium]